jgi:hypothetical protein
MPFFILHGVSEKLDLSGPTGRIPWNDIAILYFNQSEADATHTHLLVHLSLQLHSSIKSDYYMIYMKHYAWIPMKRKAPNLYMIYVGSVNHSLLVTHAKYKQIRTTCLPPPDGVKSCLQQYETKF